MFFVSSLDLLTVPGKQTPAQPGPTPAYIANPFQEAQHAPAPRPTINQMKAQPFGSPSAAPVVPAHDPWTPIPSTATGGATASPWMKTLDQPNPFLS